MYSKLLEPGYIGKMKIKNRIVVPPMLMGYGSEEGYVTEQMLDYFEKRAEGGAGMVICEVVGIRYEGKVFPYFVNCYDETHVPGLAELAARIKKHGARAAIQIGDGGRNTRSELTGEIPIGVSAIPTYKRETPRELTTSEVEEFVAKFANAAYLLKKAGFEGVEMHAAHVYLLNQFLSPLTNVRTDKYGGSLKKRCRVLVEIIEECRKLVGPDFPIWIRINQAEPGDEGGLELKDAIEIAKICEKAGYDAIHVSSGGNHYETTMASMYFPHGYLIDPTAEIKKAVNIPVIAVGRMTPQIGNKAINEGKADFIAFGRGSMVDPEFPNKLAAGNADDIMMCMNCMTCVARGVFRDKPIVCAINPVLGKEREYALNPAAISKKVMVVGAGPAGLQAAKRAVERGHKVTLVDSDSELGGQLRLMGMAPKKGPIKVWIDYMGRQLKKAGVDIELGTEAASAVRENTPDAVIVATGMQAGISHDKGSIVTLKGAMAGNALLGETVAIVGGDQMALEAADILSEQGKKVTIFTDNRKFAPAYLDLVKNRILERLAFKNASMLKQVRLESITATGVRIADKKGVIQEVKADTVILGNEYHVDTDLLSSLRDKGSVMYLVGGCRSLNEQIDAVADGFLAGNLV